MAHGIERRLKGDLFSYTFLHPDHYEDLGRYIPGDDSFHPLVQPLLPSHWQLFKQEIWFHAIPGDNSTPGQGFKIHLCATSHTAADVLLRAVPLCVAAGAAFKLVCDPRLVDLLNAKTCSRASSGKFLTVYPGADADCPRLLEELSRATADLDGPYLLSDRPYNSSKTVFYRYGGFLPRFRINLFGEKVPLIQAADGTLIQDARAPFFQTPPGIVDPFAAAPEPPGALLLQGRYSIRKALRFSNSGGIYVALDEQTGQEVLVKEARRFVNLTRGGRCDAISNLEKEAHVLQAMQDTGYVPRFMDHFREWEHGFLIEDYLAERIPLSSFRALEEIGLLVQRPLTADGVRAFCRRFSTLTRHLLRAIETFHARGILLGDLSPSNILVDPADLSVRLIDFEGAFLAGFESDRLGAPVTTGFVSPRRLRGETPAESDDLYSLGAVLFSLILPVQECFALDPAAPRRFLTDLIDHYGLPEQIREIIEALQDGDAARARAAAGILAADPLRRWRPRLEDPPSLTTDEVFETLDAIRTYILATTDTRRKDRLWPADYRVFNTNPLSLAYGALGTCLFLQRTGGLGSCIRRWILDQPVCRTAIPPGLFAGLAGIAWGLHEIGETDRALATLEEAWASPLVEAGPDLFFGTAGLGLASLYFAGQTGEDRWLRRAGEAADRLLAAARAGEPGLYWINADGEHYYGYAHGGAGVALFLLKAWQATGEDRYLEAGRAGLEHEIARGTYRGGYAVWPRSAKDSLRAPYWRYGAAGIGSVLLRYALALKDERYLDLAEQAGRYVAVRHAVFPGQLLGLAGMGELLLDLHAATGDVRWHVDACRLAEGILLFKILKDSGIAFPGEELIRMTTDYGTGSSGIGLFLSRLVQPQGRIFYDFDLSSEVTP